MYRQDVQSSDARDPQRNGGLTRHRSILRPLQKESLFQLIWKAAEGMAIGLSSMLKPLFGEATKYRSLTMVSNEFLLSERNIVGNKHSLQCLGVGRVL